RSSLPSPSKSPTQGNEYLSSWAVVMGTPPTETANGGARSAASPAAAGARSPHPTQLAPPPSASRTPNGILQYSDLLVRVKDREARQDRAPAQRLYPSNDGALQEHSACLDRTAPVVLRRRTITLSSRGGRVSYGSRNRSMPPRSAAAHGYC